MKKLAAVITMIVGVSTISFASMNQSMPGSSGSSPTIPSMQPQNGAQPGNTIQNTNPSTNNLETNPTSDSNDMNNSDLNTNGVNNGINTTTTPDANMNSNSSGTIAPSTTTTAPRP